MFDTFRRKKRQNAVHDGCFSIRLAVLALCWSCGLVVLTGTAMAESRTAPNGGNDPASAALTSCVSGETSAIDVTVTSEAGLFVDADGYRYFATEISSWHIEPRSADASPSSSEGGQARLVAVPAGEPNRWGFIPAWIIDHTDRRPRLYQTEQLLTGNALFSPDIAASECAMSLRRAEGVARRAKSGSWGTAGGARVFSGAAPASFQGNAGRYVIARGRIVSLGKTRSTRYLNFGRYWKTDLTVTLKSSDETAFNEGLGADGWQIDDLTGLFVEVRGVLQEKDGPLIALRHPEQIRVLEGKRAGRGGQNSN